jgi:alpha-ribazole phosphatase
VAVKHFLLIRHAKTKGNLERRYVGDPDEPLCAEGLREATVLAHNNILPPVAALISGPALRCRRTADVLFPGMRYDLCPMSEIDFGIFKNKTAGDLLGDKDYERWLETGCMGDIPGGDSVSGFKERCCESFAGIAGASGEETTALVIHGGNIMAIMERFAVPKQDFYSYHVPNCGYFFCRYENGTLTIERKSP